MACRGKLADQRCRLASPGEHPVGGVADRTDRAGAGGLAGFGFPFVTLGTAQLRGHQLLRRDEIAARCDYPTGALGVKKTRRPSVGSTVENVMMTRRRLVATQRRSFRSEAFAREGSFYAQSPSGLQSQRNV